jgi:hypothetical protein
MDIVVEKILEEAVRLPPNDRAAVVDRILSTLDSPDHNRIDNLWKDEAGSCIEAAKRGEMSIISKEDVFRKYKQRKS